MSASATTSHPANDVERLGEWLSEIHSYWYEETPLRVHSRDIAANGAPQWHPEFARWMLGTISNDQRWRDHYEPRLRMTRAMRKLRERFPREYEVLYRTAVLQIPIATTADWLTQRAIKNRKPERYSLDDTVLILRVAADKTASWF